MLSIWFNDWQDLNQRVTQILLLNYRAQKNLYDSVYFFILYLSYEVHEAFFNGWNQGCAFRLGRPEPDFWAVAQQQPVGSGIGLRVIGREFSGQPDLSPFFFKFFLTPRLYRDGSISNQLFWRHDGIKGYFLNKKSIKRNWNRAGNLDFPWIRTFVGVKLF